jgi:hypothetical protein
MQSSQHGEARSSRNSRIFSRFVTGLLRVALNGARGEPHPKSGAPRTLEGVGSTAWFGGFPGSALPQAQWYKGLYPRRVPCWCNASPACGPAGSCSISAITGAIDDTGAQLMASTVRTTCWISSTETGPKPKAGTLRVAVPSLRNNHLVVVGERITGRQVATHSGDGTARPASLGQRTNQLSIRANCRTRTPGHAPVRQHRRRPEL